MPREVVLVLVQVITAFSILLLVAEILFVIFNLIFKKRKDRITFLRSFKNGKFAIIYLTAYPLWWVGHLWAGKESILHSLFSTINEILSLVVMKYEVGSISGLMAENRAYRYTVYLCFAMVVMNTLLFALSLTIQYIWIGVHTVRALITEKNKLYIFGNNEKSVALYHSDKTRDKAVIDTLTPEQCDELYLNNVTYINSTSVEASLRSLLKLAKKLDREYIFVINTGKDQKNITLCRTVIDFINSSREKVRDKLYLNLKVYVYGDPKYQALYDDVVENAHGCIHYINKYQRVAMDYIDRYPLSLFMDERQIDYSTSLVREGVEINVVYVGFGKTNRQIFLASVANNQFLTNGEGGPVLKKVNYYAFDRRYDQSDKNLNHSYNRFENEMNTVDAKDYLPLPTAPANKLCRVLNINDPEFYNSIRTICSRSENDANFIVVAYGNDLENLDMAQKLVEKRHEWGFENLQIFVRAFDWSKEQTLIKDKNCHFIGNETECAYNVEKLLSDKIVKMAKMRNEVYDLEYDMTKQNPPVIDAKYVRNNELRANEKWFKSKSQMERDSSLYSCLSLRSKLNLMGLDYCEESAEGEPLSEDDYLSIYAGNDKPNTQKLNLRANDKNIVYYDLKFDEGRRKTMAIQEHQRWNSFMISRGMIPATRHQILNETKINSEGNTEYTNGKNYSLRRHGNLTTFEGLVEFRRMIAERDQKEEAKCDVIKYDYQILDDAYWLLTKAGYKIIRKNK